MEIVKINDPSKHGLVLAGLSTSIRKSIDSPSFNQLIAQGAKEERLEALLAVLILKYSNMLSVSGNLKQGQSIEIAKMIVSDWPTMSLDDFNILLSNGVKGRYGQIFRFDIEVIYSWISAYQDEYWEVKENLPKQPSALEMLSDERLNELGEIIATSEVKPILPLTEKDIRLEGQEQPKKPVYVSPDESYLELQRLKAEYGRTCRDLHTGRPLPGKPETFEEWLKEVK